MNLYELTNEYQMLQNILEDPEADADEIQISMDALDAAIEEKADGYAMIMKNMESSIHGIDSEIERLEIRKNLLQSGIDRLKRNLQQAMVNTGKTKFKTDLFSFAIQKNGGALPVIVDVPLEDLPEDLITYTINEKPNLKAIAQYMESTGDVSYAHFGDRGESLRIK